MNSEPRALGSMESQEETCEQLTNFNVITIFVQTPRNSLRKIRFQQFSPMEFTETRSQTLKEELDARLTLEISHSTRQPAREQEQVDVDRHIYICTASSTTEEYAHGYVQLFFMYFSNSIN